MRREFSTRIGQREFSLLKKILKSEIVFTFARWVNPNAANRQSALGGAFRADGKRAMRSYYYKFKCLSCLRREGSMIAAARRRRSRVKRRSMSRKRRRRPRLVVGCGGRSSSRGSRSRSGRSRRSGHRFHLVNLLHMHFEMVGPLEDLSATAARVRNEAALMLMAHVAQ